MFKSLQFLLRQWRIGRQLNVFTGARIVGPLFLSSFALFAELAALSLLPSILKALSKSGDYKSIEVPAAFASVERALEALSVNLTVTTLVVALALLLLIRQLVTTVEAIYIERAVIGAYRAVTHRLYAAWLHSVIIGVRQSTIGVWNNLIIRQAILGSQLITVYARLFKLIITNSAYIVIAFVINPFVTTVSGVYGLVVVFILANLMRRAKRVSAETIDLQNGLGDYLVDAFLGWKQIKVFNLQESELDRFDGQIKALGNTQLRLAINSAVIPLVFSFTIFFLVVGFVLLAGQFANFNINELVIYMVVVIRLLPSFQAVASRAQAVVVNGLSLERVYRAFRTFARSAEDDESDQRLPSAFGPIEFNNVSFQYGEDREFCLSDVNLTFPQGKITAVIGESGVGKSTLIDLVPRLLEPTSGTIQIDGNKVGDFKLSSLRSRVALATQDPFLFSATIRENVQAGKRSASFEEIVGACQLARIDEFVESLPEKYETLIGHGGVGLSGGQKQRLALARVFVSDADILLLDEPTSALDPNIESEIFDSIGHLVRSKNKTAIIVTHRSAFMDKADYVISLVGGKANRLR